MSMMPSVKYKFVTMYKFLFMINAILTSIIYYTCTIITKCKYRKNVDKKDRLIIKLIETFINSRQRPSIHLPL